LETLLAAEWRDIHLSFPANIKERELIPGRRQDHLELVHEAYDASQGRFELTLPGYCVYIMPEETTVENIARHLAVRARGIMDEQGRNGRLQVRAYEGIAKGASVQA
ncbi:MAG: hypothetical protein HQL31_10705, partial [Planctomycetes bacterium]|nr:hypothetical protein [Planctomycetota bacterium]